MLRRSLVLAVLAGALAAPAAAHADAFDDVFADYQADGRITACGHSEADLERARDQVPNDIEQYAPDFPDALEAALEERARTGCPGGGDDERRGGAAVPDGGQAAGHGNDGAGGAAAAGGTAPAPGGTPAPPGTPAASPAAQDGAIVNAADRTVDTAGDAPAPLLVLAVIGGVLLILALLGALIRFFAWEPRWLAGARHAVAEAGWRTSGAWEDFSDWLRGGRSPSAK